MIIGGLALHNCVAACLFRPVGQYQIEDRTIQPNGKSSTEDKSQDEGSEEKIDCTPSYDISEDSTSSYGPNSGNKRTKENVENISIKDKEESKGDSIEREIDCAFPNDISEDSTSSYGPNSGNNKPEKNAVNISLKDKDKRKGHSIEREINCTFSNDISENGTFSNDSNNGNNQTEESAANVSIKDGYSPGSTHPTENAIPRPSFQKAFICLFAMTVSAAAMAMTSITGFTPSLVTEQGSSLDNLNVVYLGIGITQIVFGAPAGILLDLPTINPHRSNIYFGLIILQGACTIGIGLAKSFSVVAAFLILQTIAHEAIYSQMSAAIGDMFGSHNIPGILGITTGAMALPCVTWPIGTGEVILKSSSGSKILLMLTLKLKKIFRNI